MLYVWSLIAAALSLSTCALFVALRSSGRSLSKRLAALLTRLENLEADQDSTRSELLTQLKRERQRANMANIRARQKATEQDEPAELLNGSAASGQLSEDEKDRWQRDMNRKILTGQVKLPGRR